MSVLRALSRWRNAMPISTAAIGCNVQEAWSSSPSNRPVLGHCATPFHVDQAANRREHCSTVHATASSSSNPTEATLDLSPAVARAVETQPGSGGESSSGRGGDDGAGVTAMRCTLRDVPGGEADLLADTLLSLGAQSASVTEHRPPGTEEQEIFDLQQGTREVWDRCTVTAHFGPDHDVEGTLKVVQSAMELEEISSEIFPVADSDWLEGICASYQPTCIVDNLWIIPSWSDPQDGDGVNIRVEPGLAFGTGEHPTTRLCLKRLYAMQDFRGLHVLDYGTGSGVLALLTLKLGATLAVGTDTDPLAVRAANQNGVLNKFSGKWIALQCGPAMDSPDPLLSHPQGFLLPTQYDVCVANILQGPLLELQTRLKGYVKPGGLLLLSGILQTQVPDVQAAYQDGFHDFEVFSDGPWALLVATRGE